MFRDEMILHYHICILFIKKIEDELAKIGYTSQT